MGEQLRQRLGAGEGDHACAGRAQRQRLHEYASTSLRIFLVRLYKYIDKLFTCFPFSPFCSVLLAAVPAPLST